MLQLSPNISFVIIDIFHLVSIMDLIRPYDFITPIIMDLIHNFLLFLLSLLTPLPPTFPYISLYTL